MEWEKNKAVCEISSFLDFHYTVGSRGNFTILRGRCGTGLLEFVLHTKRGNYFAACLFGGSGQVIGHGGLHYCETFELVPEDEIPVQIYRSVVIHARRGTMILTQESINATIRRSM